MYYIMECSPPTTEADEALLEIHNTFRVAGIRLWTNGLPIDEEKKKNVPVPIEINFDVFRSYKGDPPEFEDLGIPIMTKRLKDVLDKAGVNNIEYFPALLKNNSTGKTYPYYAYKIVGLVAIADLDASDYETYDGNPIADVSFHKLIVDEKKAKGLPLFRMAEDTSAIVVHDSIKKAIEDAGINKINFIAPKEYVQL